VENFTNSIFRFKDILIQDIVVAALNIASLHILAFKGICQVYSCQCRRNDLINSRFHFTVTVDSRENEDKGAVKR